MPVNLSIKNVPDEIAAKLRERARRHHRSLQGELMAILEEGVMLQRPPAAPTSQGPISVREALRRIDALGLKTEDDSTAWIREDRDAR